MNLNRTVIKGNHAIAGGGIHNIGGQLNLDHSTVEGNTATPAAAESTTGAARSWTRATMTMKGGALLRNRALNDGGGLEEQRRRHGVSRLCIGQGQHRPSRWRHPPDRSGSTLRLKSTTLSDNIAVSGAGLANNASTATLVRSLVTRNTAITAGGGILNENSGQVTLTSSRVIRNAPDNCSPEGSVPGCTNPAGAAPSSEKPRPGNADKVHK